MSADRSSLLQPAVFGGLIAVGLIGAGVAIGGGVVNARVGDRQVTVRGLAERDVTADLAVLTLRFTGAGEELNAVQAGMDADLTKVRAFLTAQGYPDDAITVGQLEVTDTKAQTYSAGENVARYIVGQSVTVRTKDVARVQRTMRARDTLVRDGVLLDFTSPTYVFTKLNDVRPAMIGEATASARTGAEQFAKDSHSRLGPIAQATQGSFEILARESIDDEPSSLEKKVRVVTTVTYQLK